MRVFLRNKGIISGVFMMVLYQIIMIGTFMYGYSAIPKNVSELSVAIVNEDSQYGAKFVNQIKEQLPFKVVTELSLDQAQKELEDRDLHLVMHIPKDFSQKLSEQGQQVQLDFFMNESNPATVTSTMQSVTTQISSNINAELQTQSVQGILQNLKVPQAESQQLAEQVSTKLKTNVVITNPQPAGMHNQMAPMFLSMAAYVGAMIYSMMSIGALNQIKGRRGKWKSFFALQGVNVLLSLIVPLIGVTIYFCIHGYGAETFFKIWMLHSLEMLGAIEFTSIFCLLLGQSGMLVNLPLLLIQTISSGAVLTQDMMPGFFRAISHISVMFYTVQLDYNTLFGGGKTQTYLLGLVLVTVGALILNVIIHQFKPDKGKSGEINPTPAPQVM